MLCRQYGNVETNVQELEIDALSLSGHKLYAPKGVGALYIKNGIEWERYLDGGHQEKNKRAGTENVAEIVGLGKACEIAQKSLEPYQEKLLELKNFCIANLKDKIPDMHINGSLEKRLPGNCNISFPGIETNELLFKLDERGICASGGSACSSGDDSPSHVLTAIGISQELEKGALRITFGDANTKEDVQFLVDNLVEIIEEIKQKD